MVKHKRRGKWIGFPWGSNPKLARRTNKLKRLKAKGFLPKLSKAELTALARLAVAEHKAKA